MQKFKSKYKDNMNISSNSRRALLRYITLTATANATTLKASLESLLLARVTQTIKGSGNKVLTSTSTDGESVSYTLPAANISDDDLQGFFSMVLDNIEWMEINEPTITTNSAIQTYLLQTADFNGFSYFENNRNNKYI